MNRGFRLPSPALIISVVALFVALGGTSYALSSLPANSVGSKQLKKNAVTTKKIKNHAVTAAKINPTGLTVPRATNADQLGSHAASFFAPATLQSGQSESGVWSVTDGSSTSGFASQGFAFPEPLPAALNGSHVEYLHGTTDANCPGEGQAAAGYLCAYGHDVIGLTPDNGHAISTHAGGAGADSYGFMLFFDVHGASEYGYGSWTVTAP